MSGDASLTEPAGRAGRAMQAGAPAPVLDQEFDSGNLYALRAAVQAHVDQAGLSEDRASDVVLAVHELAANAIAHGAGHGRLRLWQVPGALCCEISDEGRPAQRGLPAQPGAPAHSGPQARPGHHVSTPPPGGTGQAATGVPFPVEA